VGIRNANSAECDLPDTVLSADARAGGVSPPNLALHSPYTTTLVSPYQWAIHDRHFSEASNRPGLDLDRLQYVNAISPSMKIFEWLDG